MTQTGPFEFEGTPRFEITARLGAGGMGVVYEAFDKERQAKVALKTLRHASPELLLRLKNEFRALQDLHHPNLVNLLELFNENGQWFFTMELLPGQDFVSWVRGGVDPDQATWTADRGSASFDEVRIRSGLQQLVAGLQALHATGRVHRDVKPGNLIVSPEGRVVLLDFGLVAETEPSQQSTENAHPVGTVAYMAPEQAASQRVGPEADWYSVGVVLFECLTGRLPFEGKPLQVLLAKQERPAPSARESSPGVPDVWNRLCQRLLSHDPARRPTGDELAAWLQGREIRVVSRETSLGGTRTASFVGRAAELAALDQAFRDSRAGRCVTVLVHGASGLGKSELLRTFQRRLKADLPGAVVLSGRCYERESVPFKAFDGLVDALCGQLRRLPRDQVLLTVPRHAELLLRLFPVLGRVEVFDQLRGQRREIADQQEVRSLAFRALRELLHRLSEQAPLLLTVDDVQWADTDSLKLLRALLQPPDPPPLCLVASLRTPGEPEAAGALITGARGHFIEAPREIEVGPLPQEEAVELARELLGAQGDTSHGHPEEVARESAGHPLFIRELVQHVVTSGAALGDRAVSLDEALHQRVLALDPGLRAAVELACVSGGPMRQDVSADALGIGAAAYLRQVGQLRVLNLVRTAGPHPEDFVEPYHDRVREAVLHRLDPARRQALHRSLARALRAAAQVKPEVLALHLEGAGELAEAARFAAQAAAQAAQALAFVRAAHLYQSALAHWPVESIQGAEEVRQLRVKLGEALANAGRGVEAAKAYQEAREGASTAEALDLDRRAAEQLLRSGYVSDGIVVARRVLAALGIRYPRTTKGAVSALLWQRLLLRLRGLRYRQRDASQLPPDRLVGIDLCYSMAIGLGMKDHLRGAVFSTRYVRMALKAGEPIRLLRALALEANFVAGSGARESRYLDRLFRKGDELRAKVDYPLAGAYLGSARAFKAFAAGDWSKARDYALQAELECLREQGAASTERASVRSAIHWSLYYLGELKALADHMLPLVDEAMDRGDLFAAANMILGLDSVVFVDREGPESARSRVADILGRWSVDGYHMQHYYALLANAQADLYQDDGQGAWARVEAEWPLLERSMLLMVPSIRNEGRHLRARAALAAASVADRAGATRLLLVAERDSKYLAGTGLAWTEALAPLITAAVAVRRGDIDRASQDLRIAVERLDAASVLVQRERDSN
jgi:hypothetical protein